MNLDFAFAMGTWVWVGKHGYNHLHWVLIGDQGLWSAILCHMYVIDSNVSAESDPVLSLLIQHPT